LREEKLLDVETNWNVKPLCTWEIDGGSFEMSITPMARAIDPFRERAKHTVQIQNLNQMSALAHS